MTLTLLWILWTEKPQNTLIASHSCLRLSQHWPKLNPRRMSIKYDWVKGPALGWLTSGKGTLKESAFQGRKGQSWVLFHGWCCTVSLVGFVKESVKELKAGHWKSYCSLEQRKCCSPTPPALFQVSSVRTHRSDASLSLIPSIYNIVIKRYGMGCGESCRWLTF